MFKRLLQLPLSLDDSIFLFGPRGTGKTSWLKEHVEDAIFVNLLDFPTYSTLLANPARLRELIPPGTKRWIIIDEVQRVPELLNEVHYLIEEYQYKFILTGSSARSLRKRGINLLAGRALTYHMHPLVVQEMGETFNLENALQFGLLPKAVTHVTRKKYLQSYTNTYVKEEVSQEGLTRNISAFTRFLQAASFSQGSVVNMAEMGRELAINRLVIANYFEILEDLLLSIKISPFTFRAKRKVIAHQKFYFFDIGIFRTLRKIGPGDKNEELAGPALETLFLQSARALNDYLELEYDIQFWRTIAGIEVDFILFGPHGFHAFEIKHSSKIATSDLKGLQEFSKDYPEAKLYILYRGVQKLYFGNITAYPFEEALRNLPTLLGSNSIKTSFNDFAS